MTFKSLRLRIGTQEDLALAIDRSQQTVAKWESGITYPRRPLLKKLSEIFNCTESEILAAIDDSKSNKTEEDRL